MSANHVAPLVDPPVLLQPVVLAGARDELPQARGAAARIGDRVEGALDDRQQRKLERHAAFLELAHDVIEVTLAATEGPVEEVRLRAVSLDLARDREVLHVGQRIPGPNAVEQVGVLVRRQVREVAVGRRDPGRPVAGGGGLPGVGCVAGGRLE